MKLNRRGLGTGFAFFTFQIIETTMENRGLFPWKTGIVFVFLIPGMMPGVIFTTFSAFTMETGGAFAF